MQAYPNTGGNSNILSYAYTERTSEQTGEIRIEFSDGSVYRYTDASCGASVVDTLIGLARTGHGLNSFISKNKPSYAEKS